MATTQIYLKGGPLHGRTVSADEIVGGLVAYIQCRGGYYVASAGQTRPNGNPIWDYAGKTAPGPPGGSNTTGIHKGWHDLTLTLGKHRLGAKTGATHRLDAATLRAIRRARKV